MKLVTMLSFSGAPLLFSLIYTSEKPSGEKDDLAKLALEEKLIAFATAASSIFALSVFPGDNSYLHHIFLAALFGAAAYGAHFVLPIVLSKVPADKKPVVEPHTVVVFAALELLLANLLLFIVSFVLPQSVLDNEHSLGAVLIYTILGLAFLGGANVLSNGFLADKLPPQTLALALKGGVLAVVASYVILLFSFVLFSDTVVVNTSST